jgi:hypothetical protein
MTEPLCILADLVRGSMEHETDSLTWSDRTLPNPLDVGVIVAKVCTLDKQILAFTSNTTDCEHWCESFAQEAARVLQTCDVPMSIQIVNVKELEDVAESVNTLIVDSGMYSSGGLKEHVETLTTRQQFMHRCVVLAICVLYVVRSKRSPEALLVEDIETVMVHGGSIYWRGMVLDASTPCSVAQLAAVCALDRKVHCENDCPRYRARKACAQRKSTTLSTLKDIMYFLEEGCRKNDTMDVCARTVPSGKRIPPRLVGNMPHVHLHTSSSSGSSSGSDDGSEDNP